jgi:hypothetical protein
MSASLPLEVLKKYKGAFTKFFETGTSEGDSTQAAIDAGFEEMFTTELDPPTYRRAFARFNTDQRVHVYNSESVGALKMVLPFIEAPILFFLDAHPDCHRAITPVLDELGAIKGHKYPVSIIIDDMRLMGKELWKDITIPVLVNKLYEINPSFEIVFEENGHAPGDLLVARIPVKE